MASAIGCGLRRGEISALLLAHLQLRDDTWVIVDLLGKHARMRSVPVPGWVKRQIDTWLTAAGITEGHVFRRVRTGGKLVGSRLSGQAVYNLASSYGFQIGCHIAAHDLRRRFAKLAQQGNASLEQIQFALGHSSLVTTERYVGLRQNLEDAPGDRIQLEL